MDPSLLIVPSGRSLVLFEPRFSLPGKWGWAHQPEVDFCSPAPPAPDGYAGSDEWALVGLEERVPCPCPLKHSEQHFMRQKEFY